MTCIVGLEHGGKVYVGGDSCMGGATDASVGTRSKVFKKENFIFGYTSSFRFGQILEYKFSPTPKLETQNSYEYLHTTVVDHIRDILKCSGYTRIENNVELGGECLIGYDKKLWCLQTDFSLLNFTSGFTCIGCGERLAVGAMKALEKTKPKERIIKSLEIASKFDAFVLPPFNIVEL